MANDYFRFQRFTIHQSQCAMKVGTDGTLLGAWAMLPIGNDGLAIHPERKTTAITSPAKTQHVLDIGTGTGLIALMMAQRYPDVRVTGIDIDPLAVEQAKENVARSPFAKRIDIVLGNVCQLIAAQPFDAIVSNPPYFDQSLACPDDQRTQARHTSSLSYRDLMSAAWRLLSDTGVLSLVIPADYRQRLESEASIRGFFKVRQCGVRTTPCKPVRRYLLAFAKHPAPMMEQDEEILELQPKIRSPWYQELTSEFYLQEGVGHKDGQQHDDGKDESST